jgi:hypothetical protein
MPPWVHLAAAWAAVDLVVADRLAQPEAVAARRRGGNRRRRQKDATDLELALVAACGAVR